MTPTPLAAPASKQTIEELFRGASTRRAYDTPDDCTDFFHHLYTNGKKARTIDVAKSALVAHYNNKRITPNPAQDANARRYIVGLQKFNKKNNVDEERKAHPLTVQEQSTLMKGIAGMHPFVSSLLRLLLSVGFLGCFRISEVLNLRYNDVQLVSDCRGRYLSVRLRWHKKANVEADCQIYHLVDETTYPCLRVCTFHEEYLSTVRASGANLSSTAFVFPNVVFQHCGVPRIDWQRALEQKVLRNPLGDIVDMTPNLPIGISLHSLRRGGAYYRVFESTERRFNFRELMAWCRWSDAKTCCEYLVTQSISNDIDPRNLLRTGALQRLQGLGLSNGGESGLHFSLEEIGNAVAKSLQSIEGKQQPVSKTTKQSSMNGFITKIDSYRAIGTASMATVVRGRSSSRAGCCFEGLQQRHDPPRS
ncbi:hypothetical protein H310_10377 [Aphanomyces invadans]|uniref:Tyr recombinase domain-containing protein n=1 Tax=Aphanomyces invadans TaxID=157072 RepID=A0A024TQ72_9STRA|nr:hypothetical protein H310_10377 [Aphanomyces invadans]ETV96183.1 hypothetical protein H310_10377 [Aphanomyces invadans]|eukprot:XP_008874975.1 hypothetical protein H310_10377 [Aphanomyces invadans]